MKRTIRKFAVVTTTFCALAFTACSTDDDPFEPVAPPVSENADLQGNLTESLTLDPSVEYNLTGSLLVKSGATLTIPAGTQIVADVSPDSYIIIEKGAKIDVQGTAAKPVVMRSANREPGDWGGLLLLGDAPTTEGADAVGEVAGVVYGGANATDNSGSIKYLVIEGSGAQINAESQYNGLTLYAVGSGTRIDNVAILNGSDDGVEFFGGTVSVTNLYVENTEDDAVDWTEGWNGTLTNTYVFHNIDGFSTAIEADGVNGNPSIKNFTAVSTSGGTALQFKKESGATMTGLSLTGYDTSVDMANDGPLANISIEGEIADTERSYTTKSAVNLDSFDWVSNRGTTDATLLQGVVSGEVTLDPSIAYELTSSYIIEAGGKLTIPAGTKITARAGGTDVYIAVLKGAQIDIQGTSEKPVVISSAEAKPGDWGGLTIAGSASTTEGVDAVAEVGGFIYGGTNDEDNSGSIKNLVILGTGAQINSESQYNGISLYAVGSATTIENIAVINGSDDGVEFFGGTVSATNIYVENTEDDAIDWTEGWNGSITNTYVKHSIEGFSTAIEADGANGNPSIVNFTAVSTTGGTALQFKKESGATFTNLYLDGYDTNVDMANDGPLANVKIEGTAASLTEVYNKGAQVDVSAWAWLAARL